MQIVFPVDLQELQSEMLGSHHSMLKCMITFICKNTKVNFIAFILNVYRVYNCKPLPLRKKK